jgi:hypothetical protein
MAHDARLQKLKRGFGPHPVDRLVCSLSETCVLAAVNRILVDKERDRTPQRVENIVRLLLEARRGEVDVNSGKRQRIVTRTR